MGIIYMTNTLTNIQQTLNGIDTLALEGDWQLKFEVMTLLIASIQTIMNELRNETKPKQKTITKNNYITRYKDVVRNTNAAGTNTNSNIRKGLDDAERLRRERARLQAHGTMNDRINNIQAQ